jgi:hypothetical protein
VLLCFAFARTLGRSVIELCLYSAYFVSMVSFLYRMVGNLI